MNEVGKFLNSAEGEGWNLHWIRNDRWCWLWSKAKYEFALVYPDPLTWQDDAGYWRPDQYEAETDLGSIPPPLRGIMPHDQFIVPYCFHDSAWRKGGLWFCKTLDGEWRFIRMGRNRSNMMLKRWVRSMGGVFAQWPILIGVSIGMATKWLSTGCKRLLKGRNRA
jgi:hypothetical protein